MFQQEWPQTRQVKQLTETARVSTPLKLTLTRMSSQKQKKAIKKADTYSTITTHSASPVTLK